MIKCEICVSYSTVYNNAALNVQCRDIFSCLLVRKVIGLNIALFSQSSQVALKDKNVFETAITQST